MKASDFLINFLLSHNIDKVFGYIGGAIAHIYHSIANNPRIEIINGINEQGSAFAAEGYARISGKCGIVFATSGPGATNLITAIGSAYFDSIPLVCITGQVNTYEYKYDKLNRQIGFQETDIVSIVKPIVKYAVMIDKIENLRYELEKAFFISQFQRKGPVLIDIPMNIQRIEFDFSNALSFFDTLEYQNIQKLNLASNLYLDDFIKKIQKSKRPIILVGGGVRLSNAFKELDNFARLHRIPIVHSLMGKDSVKSSYELNLGLIGAYGNRCANLALANSDLILVLGSRLDTRQTGTDLKSFAREAQIIQVDIDEIELGSKVKVDIKIKSDIREFLSKILKKNMRLNCKEWEKWIKKITKELPTHKDINGKIKKENFLIELISQKQYAHNVSVDVGQHQMWVAQSFKVFENTRILFSGGMGAMGFALPCAIGACIANNKRTIVIAGDGGLQMNIQELEVIKRRKLPIKIFVFNNQNLGMVRQFQELYFDKKYLGTFEDYSVPNFASIAKAYGLKARKISKFDDFENELADIFSNDNPELIDIILPEKFSSVEPKLIVGKPIEDMFPFMQRKKFKSLMIIKPLEDE